MIDILGQHLKNRLGTEVDQLDFVLSKFKPLTLKRKQVLVVQGEICEYVYYIVKGCLQVYVCDQEMNETTRDLFIEDSWCSELISFRSGEPAVENIRTLEPSQVLCLNRNNFAELMANVPQFDKTYTQILESFYANSVYRISSFVSLSALDRIRWLMQHRPALVGRVSNKILSSYLGINKDVFSRLRSKL